MIFLTLSVVLLSFAFMKSCLQNLFYVPFIEMNLLVFFISRNMADCWLIFFFLPENNCCPCYITMKKPKYDTYVLIDVWKPETTETMETTRMTALWRESSILNLESSYYLLLLCLRNVRAQKTNLSVNPPRAWSALCTKSTAKFRESAWMCIPCG
jgi:hypothetical protein